MPELSIHRLSDPFALPAQLAAALCGPDAPADPLALVQVVLPAAGWRGWLARRLADRLGVLAGVELLDVAGFRRQFSGLSSDSTLPRVLSAHAVLPAAAAADPTLAAWLARDPDGCWRVALAQHVAQALAEDAWRRPLAAVEADAAAPAWWRALRAALPEPAPVAALDADTHPAALHWVATVPLLAHDWALLSGLARVLPVTVWLLDPDAATRSPVSSVLDAEAPRVPPALAANLKPLAEADRATADPLAGALSVGSAATLWGQLRLVEAWLAERFAADPGLSPADVLVLSPALPGVAPLVDAVFGAAAGMPWPYRIGGRRSPAAATSLLARLLQSPAARMTAAELPDWLSLPALAAGLRLDPQAPMRLRALLPEAGVGWGLDARSRRDWQAGEDAAHSWQAQLPLLAARLAADDPLQQALPRLLAALIAYREDTRGALPLSAHVRAFAALLDALLPARQHPAVDAVRLGWASLAAEAGAVADDPLLTQPAFAALLTPCLPQHVVPEPSPPESAAPEAGLRFAPLRAGAIRPARLIVLFGLDALSFPQRPTSGPLEGWRSALDAAHPALAPPEPAAVDRELLLESMWLAADATLWVWADRDPLGGQPLPAPAPIEAVLLHRPDARRFRPSLPPLSLPPSATPAPAPDPAPRRPSANVSLTDFCSCFREPARFQWVKIRRMALPAEPLPVDGPLRLTAAAAWQLRGEFLQCLDRDGVEALPAVPDAAAQARLPPGTAGFAAWSTLRTEALQLWQYHHDLLLDGGKPDTVTVDLALEEPALRLDGRLRVHAGQLVERVAGPPQARHLLHAWLRGLALAAMEVSNADLLLLGLSARGPMHLVLRLPAAAEAQDTLGALLAWYARALEAPLPFTPALGLALLEHGEREARTHWLGHGRTPGESAEPLNRALWQGADLSAPPHREGLEALSRLLLPRRLIRAWREHWA